MVRTKAKPRRQTVQLREERASGFAPLAAGGQRVDRAKCIIYGVKIAGLRSPNTPIGVQGANGTDYLPEAFAKALPLYEGAMVNVNHPPRTAAGQVRDTEDRLGKIKGVYLHEGEPYGNLHLIPSHRMTSSLLDAAENTDLSDCFALSHNSLGIGEVRNGRYVVSEIPVVRSVDVVTIGGTTRSLFESEQPMKIKVRQLFEAAGPKLKVSAKKRPRLAAFVTRLLEDDDYSAVMDSDTDATEPPADHEQALKDGFEASVAAIVKKCLDGEEDPKECIQRIKELLSAHDKLTDDDDDEDLEEADDSDEGDDDKGDKGDKKDDAKKVEESRKHCTRLAKGYLQLQENQQPAKSLVEALVKLPDEDARLSLLESWPKGTPAPAPRGGSAPRSAPTGRPILESSAPKTAEDQAALLLR